MPGRFAVKLKRPGDVLLGYAFLQPGPLGTIQGPARAARHRRGADGPGAHRHALWGGDGQLAGISLKMIGPRDRRQPYRGCWYPYSTNGFGIFEFLDFCVAAGFLGIPALNSFETPQDVADFLEYANGPADSRWELPLRRTATPSLTG